MRPVEAECARLERAAVPAPLRRRRAGPYDRRSRGHGRTGHPGSVFEAVGHGDLWIGAGRGLCRPAGARTNRNHRARMQYRAILDHYNVDSMDELLDRCDSWRETLAEYSRQTAELKRQRNAWEIQMTHLGERMTELMASIRAFAPEIVDVTQAKAAIQRAIHLQQFYAAAQREESRAPGPGMTRCRRPLAAAGTRCRRQRRRRRPGGGGRTVGGSAAGIGRGPLPNGPAAGPHGSRWRPAQWSAKEAVLTSKIARMQRRLDALNLALDALSQANETLQTRFSPQLNRLAGQYMARLTDGRYDQVLLDQNLQVTARPAGQAINRPLQALSSGTGDHCIWPSGWPSVIWCCRRRLRWCWMTPWLSLMTNVWGRPFLCCGSSLRSGRFCCLPAIPEKKPGWNPTPNPKTNLITRPSRNHKPFLAAGAGPALQAIQYGRAAEHSTPIFYNRNLIPLRLRPSCYPQDPRS